MRVGVLGGTFDPPHAGHLRMARLAQRFMGLEAVLWVPCFRQPLKRSLPSASPFHRAAMVALSIQGHRDWRLCDIELARGSTSYTVETLEELRRSGSGNDLFLILGSDSYGSLRYWKRYRDIPALASFVVVPREKTANHGALAGVPVDRVRLLRSEPLPVSSTIVRDRLAAGAPVSGLVPAAVARYIAKHRLYEGETVRRTG